MGIFGFDTTRDESDKEIGTREENKVEEIENQLGNEEKKDLLELEDEEERAQDENEGLLASISSFFSEVGGFFGRKRAPTRNISKQKQSWRRFFGVASDMLSSKRTEEGEENIYKQRDEDGKEVAPDDLAEHLGVKAGKKETDVKKKARELIEQIENGPKPQKESSKRSDEDSSNSWRAIAGKTWFLTKLIIAGESKVELNDMDYKKIIRLRKPLGIMRRDRSSSIVSEDIGINYLNIDFSPGSKFQIDYDAKQEERSVELINGNLDRVDLFGFTVNAKNVTYDSKEEGLKCEEASFIKVGILGEEGVIRGKFKNIIIYSNDKLKFDEAEGKVSNVELGENIELESFNVNFSKFDEDKGFEFEAEKVKGSYSNDDYHVYGSIDDMSFKLNKGENDEKVKIDNANIKDFNVSTPLIDLDIKNAKYIHDPFSISTDRIGITLGTNIKDTDNEGEEEEQKSLFSLNNGGFLDYINLNGFTISLNNLIINNDGVKFDVGLSMDKIIIDMSYFRSTINIADDSYNLKVKEISFPDSDDDNNTWFSPETPEIMLYPGLFLYAGASMGGGISLEGELDGGKQNRGWNLKGDIGANANFFADMHAGVGVGSELIAALKGELFAKTNVDFKTNIGSELMGVKIEKDSSNKRKLRYDNFKFIYDMGFDFVAAVGARVKGQALKIFKTTLYTVKFKEWNFAKVKLKGEMAKDENGELRRNIVKDQVQFIWNEEPPIEESEPVKDAVRIRNKLLEAGAIYMADQSQENPRKELGEEAEELEEELVKYLQETRDRLKEAKNDLQKKTKKESKVFKKADKHIDKHQNRLSNFEESRELVETLRDDNDRSFEGEEDREKYKALIANIFSESNVKEAEKSLLKSQGQYTLRQLYEMTKQVTERKSEKAFTSSGKEKNRKRLEVLESNTHRDRSIVFSEENLQQIFSKNALDNAIEGIDTPTDLDDELSMYEYRKAILENTIKHTEDRVKFYEERKSKSLSILKALEEKCTFFEDEEKESKEILNNISEAVSTPVILQQGESRYMEAIAKGLEKERKAEIESEENKAMKKKAKADRLIVEMENEAEFETEIDRIEAQLKEREEAS